MKEKPFDDLNQDDNIKEGKEVLKLEVNKIKNNINLRAKDRNQSSRRSIYLKNNNEDNSNDNLDNIINVEEIKIEYDEKEEESDNQFVDDNINIRDVINSALFSQLSEINVKLLKFNEDLSKRIFNKEGKVLPKIDYVEFTLLNQSLTISQFKKYGFGIYVFFLYLINLIITFLILLIFAFYYIGCIFFKYILLLLD